MKKDTRQFAEIEWTTEEQATEWSGPEDDLPGQPLEIERTAKARVGQYDLTVWEIDRSANGEPVRAWLTVAARNVEIVRMLTDSGDFAVASLEAGKVAGVEIARALIKAGCCPVRGWWNDANYSRFPEL